MVMDFYYCRDAITLLMLILAIPLIVRLSLILSFTSVLAVVLGAILLVVLAATFGILSKGKKLFEVCFFMLTYANINGIPFIDYFGAFEHHSFYVLQLGIMVMVLLSLSFIMRKHQLEA